MNLDKGCEGLLSALADILLRQKVKKAKALQL